MKLVRYAVSYIDPYKELLGEIADNWAILRIIFSNKVVGGVERNYDANSANSVGYKM